jgi:hypothetical protein
MTERRRKEETRAALLLLLLLLVGRRAEGGLVPMSDIISGFLILTAGNIARSEARTQNTHR